MVIKTLNRAQRLLILYSRLLKNRYINKEEIAYEFGVNPRTVQRDIDEIRTFLSDSNEHFYRQDIVYNHSLNAYSISNRKLIKDSYPLRMILTQLYSLSPIMHQKIFDTLKIIINENYSHDITELSRLLKRFKTIDNDSNYKFISQIQNAIQENKLINIVYKDKIIQSALPLEIYYRQSDFFLIYKYERKEETIKLSGIQSIQIENKYADNYESISTFEMTKDIWHVLKDLYEVNLIESIKDNSIIVSFNMMKNNVFEVLVTYSPHIRLINSPYAKDFYDHVLSLNHVYITQKIVHKPNQN